MALTNIAGVGGGFTTISGFAGKVRGFDYDLELPTVDITGFGDGGFATSAGAGGNKCTGTARGVTQFGATGITPVPAGLLDGATAPAGHTDQTGALTLTFASSCTWAFTAWMNRVSGSRNETGEGQTNWSFESSGYITQAWVVA